MKLTMHSPLFAMTLATVSAVCGPGLFCTSASGQSAVASPSVSSTTQPNSGLSGAEILSDTRGVNFNPYLKEILNGIYGRWTGLLPQEAREPTLAKGVTEIRFTISPDGRIAAMHLDASTHDDQLNRAAWGAISGAQQFPPLPAAFTGPSLELRVHFRVNTEVAGSGRS